jgi:hypothetical protein
MRQHLLAAAGATLLAGALLAGCGNDEPTDPDDLSASPQTETDPDADPGAQPATQALDVTPELAEAVATMRAATGQYVTDLSAAQEAGYQVRTHAGDSGFQLLDPTAPEQFEPTKPSMLVYTGSSEQAQLAGLGWVFTEAPAELPLDGAGYGTLPATCHYEDGMSVPGEEEADCEQAHPETGGPFTFWHPELTTLHVWAWSANPDGLFAPTNPLID